MKWKKVQTEAARIVTGTTKLVSLDKLYRETGWQTLEVRRTKHKLCLFYKMSNNLTPAYLTSLIPQTFENTVTYNLRGSQNIRPVLTRIQLYYKSFLPSCIREWNELPDQIKILRIKGYIDRINNQQRTVVTGCVLS